MPEKNCENQQTYGKVVLDISLF